MESIDTPFSVAKSVRDVLAAGYHGIIRYISPNTHAFPTKQLTTAEAKAIHVIEGMKVGLVYETASTTPGYFTEERAHADAKAVVAVVSRLKVPKSVPVFLAVDFDAKADDLEGPITDYFTVLHQDFQEHGRLVGVYGSGQTCEFLKGKGLAHATWLAQATHWANYTPWKAQADLIQGSQKNVLGKTVGTNHVANESVLW